MMSILFWFLLVLLIGTNESKFLSNRGKSKKNRKNHGKGPVKGIDDDDISLNDFIKKGVKKRGKSNDGHNVNKEKLCQYYKNIPIYGACIVMEYEDDDNNDEDGYVDFGVYYDKKELRKHIKNTKSKLSDDDIKDIISNDLGDNYSAQDFTFNCNKWIYHIDDIPYVVLMCIVNEDEENGQLIIPDGDTDNASLYYEYVIDAQTGEILQKTNLLNSVQRLVSVTDAKIGNDGTLGLLSITEETSTDDSGNNILLYHTGYNLAVQDCNYKNYCSWLHCSSESDCEPGSKDTNGGYGTALLAYHYAVKTYGCFNDYLGENPVTLTGGDTLPVRVHFSALYEGAFWKGDAITFGDGGSTLYPLVSMDVMAHELAHGYTEAKSNLHYSQESGGMNEAFSDLAGKACEKYERGSFEWGIGVDIYKQSGTALRYMNNPPQDGFSIDHYSNYHDGLDVHYSSGVYNKAFYLMITKYGLDITDVFKIAGRANVLYWTTQSTMSQGAEGMILAADDLGLNAQAIKNAFIDVGVNPPVTETGYGQIRISSGLCLDGTGLGNSDNVLLWNCDGQDNKLWKLNENNQIISKTSRCLDGTYNTNGANVLLWDCDDGENKKWYFSEKSIKSSNNLCLDGTYNTNGANVLLWSCTGNSNQQWEFVEIGDSPVFDINLLNDKRNDNHEQNGEESFMKRFIYPDYTYFIPVIGITLIINFMVYHFCIKPKFKNHSYDLVDQAKDIQVVH